MPMSAAAMDGIRANGHRWKFHMNGLIREETKKLGEFNDLLDGEDDFDQQAITREMSEPVVIALRTKIAKWLDEHRTLPDNIKDDIRAKLDDLEMVEDCDMGEINFAMNYLYDEFDYWRICTG